MRLLEIIIDRFLHNEEMNLWEMANLFPQVTGLDGLIVYVSSGRGMRHGPRIKVAIGNKWSKNIVTIPLTGIPRVIGKGDLTQDQFADIVKWITTNKATLLKYWNGDIEDTKIFIQEIIPNEKS